MRCIFEGNAGAPRRPNQAQSGNAAVAGISATVHIASLITIDRPFGRTRCLLLAHSGHRDTLDQCPLLGVKRTSGGIAGSICGGHSFAGAKPEQMGSDRIDRLFLPLSALRTFRKSFYTGTFATAVKQAQRHEHTQT